jgi:hypothetical protein
MDALRLSQYLGRWVIPHLLMDRRPYPTFLFVGRWHCLVERSPTYRYRLIEIRAIQNKGHIQVRQSQDQMKQQMTSYARLRWLYNLHAAEGGRRYPPNYVAIAEARANTVHSFLALLWAGFVYCNIYTLLQLAPCLEMTFCWWERLKQCATRRLLHRYSRNWCTLPDARGSALVWLPHVLWCRI